MTTGSAVQASSPDDPIYNGESNNITQNRDAELESLVQSSNGLGLNDLVSYEITFRPTADHFSFDFLFASEEYPGFICGE